MQRYGMSLVRNFTLTKLLSNYYYTSAAGMTGTPPFSFGAVFIMSSTVDAADVVGIWGNLDVTGNTGWGIYVEDEWETLTNQIITVHIGTSTLSVGSDGSGDKISSGLGRAAFVVCTCDSGRTAMNLYYQGQLIDTDVAPSPVASADDVLLGTLTHAEPFSFGGVNLAFYTNNVLTEVEIQSMWEQLQNYSRLPEDLYIDPQTPYNYDWEAWQTTARAVAPAIDIDYMWQAHHLRNGGYDTPVEADQIPVSGEWTPKTWESRSTSGAAAKTLTHLDPTPALPTVYQEYLPRVQWAGIVPQTP